MPWAPKRVAGPSTRSLREAEGRLEHEEAEDHFGKALKIQNQLVKDSNGYISFVYDLAELQGAHGDALLRLGKPADAEKSYRDSLTHLQVVIDKNPDDLSRQPLLALTHERLGAASRLLGKGGPRGEHCKQAIQLRGELLQLENGNLARKMAYLLALAHGDEQTAAATFLTKVGPEMTKSPVLLMQVARCWALCASGKAPGKEKCVRLALDALRGATRDGYKDAVTLETDLDLVSLREDGAFRELIAEIKERK